MAISASSENGGQTALRTVPANALIARDFAAFTGGLSRDGVLSIQMFTAGGPVQVNGGGYGVQTIQSLPVDPSLQQYLQEVIRRLDDLLAIDFEWAPSLAEAEIRFYLDSEIQLGGDGVTIGIALSNSTRQGQFWEVILNGPELAGEPDLGRFAVIHELGHVMGLEHSFDFSDRDGFGSANPSKSAYPEETVMAYRNPLGDSWPEWYTQNDLNALQRLWGRETVTGHDALTRASLRPSLWGQRLLGFSNDLLTHGFRAGFDLDRPGSDLQPARPQQRWRPDGLASAGLGPDPICGLADSQALTPGMLLPNSPSPGL